MPWRHREPLDPAPSLAILPHPPLQPLPILFPASNYTQETPPSSHPGSQILTVNTSPSSFPSNNIFPIFYIILTIPSYPDTYFTGILGGGFLLGSLVMVMEDAEAPHHLLLLRNFMAQGLVHQQPLLFASPSEEPRAFLGTLPAPVGDRKEERRRVPDPDREGKEQGLRIAWQYKKYIGEQPVSQSHSRDVKQEFSNIFDLRKSIERHLLSSQNIECMSFEKISDLGPLRERCSSFLSKLQWDNSSIGLAGRIAIQSLCAPQCGFSDWDMVSFVRSLRAMLRSSRAVAIITFPSSILPHSFSKRWQHLADTLLSVKAIPDDDKDLANLLTGYQDMVGLLHVHKVARIGSQVPVILEAKTFSLKLRGRRSLILEKLNQAPVEGSSGTSYGTSGSCTASFKGSSIDF